ncbi:hypothetical protein Pelo_3470 [Pelomyxa schiedti]|nr:hypothetical protein Pelo_3470 [Pelomyxa schiedti]
MTAFRSVDYFIPPVRNQKKTMRLDYNKMAEHRRPQPPKPKKPRKNPDRECESHNVAEDETLTPPFSLLSSPASPSELPTGMSSSSSWQLRDQFVSLLLSAHPRCGSSCKPLRCSSSTRHGDVTSKSHQQLRRRWFNNRQFQQGAKVVWEWLVYSPTWMFRMRFQRESLVTFRFLPLMGSLVGGVKCWRDERPKCKVVCVNDTNVLCEYKPNDTEICFDLVSIETRKRLISWKTKATYFTNGKWLVMAPHEGRDIEVTPLWQDPQQQLRFDEDGDVTRAIAGTPRGLVTSLCCSQAFLWFNRSVLDEAVIVTFQRRSDFSCWIRFRLVDVAQLWSTRKFTELSRTKTDLNSNIAIDFQTFCTRVYAGLVLTKHTGDHCFILLIRTLIYGNLGKYIVEVEERTGKQRVLAKFDNNRVGHSIYQMTGSLYCIQCMEETEKWWKLMDCNSVNKLAALRVGAIPSGCADFIAEGGLLFTSRPATDGIYSVEVTRSSNSQSMQNELLLLIKYTEATALKPSSFLLHW